MKWINRIKLLQISKFLIIVCLILSIVLAGFTIYGDKVGNFVISTQEQDPGIKIAITQYEDLSHQTDILAIKGLTEQTNTTLERIPFDVSYGLGDKSDIKFKRYLAYSFYLVNNSATTVDLTAVIQITEMINHLDSAVRVMLIMGDESRGEVFAKEQEDADYKPLGIAEDSPYVTTMFRSAGTVMEKDISGLEKDGKLKLTVVVWLEGWDAQCTDAIIGGSMKLNMSITAQ